LSCRTSASVVATIRLSKAANTNKKINASDTLDIYPTKGDYVLFCESPNKERPCAPRHVVVTWYEQASEGRPTSTRPGACIPTWGFGRVSSQNRTMLAGGGVHNAAVIHETDVDLT
jgi:hypothetical protein